MEDPKTDKAIIPQIDDLRQSQKWGEYLAWLGWKSVVTSSGVNLEILSTKIGAMVKIQRPHALSQAELDEINKICLENKALFIKLEPTYYQDTETLVNTGYKKSYSPLSPPSTMYIDLTQKEEDLWGKINKGGRYEIRHSEAETVFYKNPSEEILKSLYKLFLETSQKQKFTIQSFEDLKKKAEVFKDDCFVVLSYDKEKNITGGKFFLGFKDNVWYIHAGTNHFGRKSDAGHKMMWESFLYFKNLGYKILDMDGIDDPRFPVFTKHWGGFSFFKEKFGGIVVRFPHSYVLYIHPFFKFLNRFKELPI